AWFAKANIQVSVISNIRTREFCDQGATHVYSGWFKLQFFDDRFRTNCGPCDCVSNEAAVSRICEFLRPEQRRKLDYAAPTKLPAHNACSLRPCSAGVENSGASSGREIGFCPVIPIRTKRQRRRDSVVEHRIRRGLFVGNGRAFTIGVIRYHWENRLQSRKSR